MNKRIRQPRQRANDLVFMAKKAGRLLPSPCERCQSPDSIAHHEDYSRPLAVTWLCHKCHKARHRELGWGASGAKRSALDFSRFTLPGENRLGVRRAELRDFFGSEQLARELVADGWLKPVIQRKKLTLFAAVDVVKAFDRLVRGERPTQIHRYA